MRGPLGVSGLKASSSPLPAFLWDASPGQDEGARFSKCLTAEHSGESPRQTPSLEAKPTHAVSPSPLLPYRKVRAEGWGKGVGARQQWTPRRGRTRVGRPCSGSRQQGAETMRHGRGVGVGSESLWQDADKKLMGEANAPAAELRAAGMREGSPGPHRSPGPQGALPARSQVPRRVESVASSPSHQRLMGGDSPTHTISEACS